MIHRLVVLVTDLPSSQNAVIFNNSLELDLINTRVYIPDHLCTKDRSTRDY